MARVGGFARVRQMGLFDVLARLLMKEGGGGGWLSKSSYMDREGCVRESTCPSGSITRENEVVSTVPSLS